MRILFTGGSGKAGKHAIAYLMEQGHRVLNVDRVPLDLPGLDNRIADISDAGQVYDVMSSYVGYDELEAGTGVPKFDAVVHFAAVPRMLMMSDNECYRVNTLGTYNMIDAAVEFWVGENYFSSSEAAYGVCFSAGGRQPGYIPLFEEHPPFPLHI